MPTHVFSHWAPSELVFLFVVCFSLFSCVLWSLLDLIMSTVLWGKPTTLAALGLKAQDADNIYWMQEEESCLKSKSSGNNRNLGKKDLNKSSNSNNSPSKPFTNSSSNNNSSLSKPSKGPSKNKPKNSISDKLGKNGKLTGDERDRRMKEGLCLYCSEKGHVAHDCPKSAAAKARAAKVSAPESKADTADSKK